MKLHSVGTKIVPAFGRALTTQEEKDWAKLQTRAKKALDLNDTFMICFDSCMPEAKGEDKGIGSSFSKAAKDFTDFATRKFGITGVQYAPQGRLPVTTPSPFSATTFAMGEHLIDLKQLTTPEFGEILSKADYKKALLKDNPEAVNYEALPPQEGSKMSTAIQSAFVNFEKLPESSPLMAEYNRFVQENQDWLEKEAIYDCLEQKYGTNVLWREWDEQDRDLFDGKHDPKARIAQIKAEYQNTFNKTFFTQFILDKQQQAAKAKYNLQGQKLVGDCLIGFGGKEEWAYREAFIDGKCLGAQIRDGDSEETIRSKCWGLPAIDFSQLKDPNSIATKLFERKIELYSKRYDGLRIDAAWQLIKPNLFDTKTRQPEQQQPEWMGDTALKIIDKVLEKSGRDLKTYPVMLEILGASIYPDNPALKGRMQMGISTFQRSSDKYLEYGPGSVNFFRLAKGLDGECLIFGLGTHDHMSLIELANDPEKRNTQAPVLAANLGVDENCLRNDSAWFRDAKFAEIFTTENNFFTVFDAMGMDKRINTQNEKDKENWGARVPADYEETYHKNAIKGSGLNLPHAYLTALKVKGCNDQGLLNALQSVGDILREDNGAYTQKAADSKLGKSFTAIS